MNARAIGVVHAAALLAACGGGSNDSTESTQAVRPSAEAQSAARRMVWGTYAFDRHVPEPVLVEDRDGWAYWQGDIILGRTEDIVMGTTARARDDGRAHAEGVYATYGGRWKSGILTYDLALLQQRQRDKVMQAMKHIASTTRIRFSRDITKYATSRDTPDGREYDYVSFQPTNDPNLGGSSAVGRTGAGPQPLTLNPNLDTPPYADTASVTVHELAHALAAWHEQSRSDRDTYVTVLTANIIPAYIHNFDTHTSDGTKYGAYDYCSIMHYPSDAFGINRATTLVAKQPFTCTIGLIDGSGTRTSHDLGQDDGLSPGDIAMLNAVYASAPANRPVANAGLDFRVSGLGTRTAQLDASASFAVSGASIVSYQWNPVGWVPCEDCNNPVLNPTSAKASVPLTIGGTDSNYTAQFEVTVTDSAGRTMSDVVTITRTKS